MRGVGSRAIVGVVCTLLGCSRSEKQLPIPREMLAEVLVAVHVAETVASLDGTSTAEARLETLRDFGFDTTDFNETIRMLAGDPETGKEVYQAVLDSVIFEQREIRSKLMADSIPQSPNTR